GYEDWDNWLPSNRAVALQAEVDGPAVPYTRAIAHEAGWHWKIALQHRIGCGIVFSNAHMSDDEATARLLKENPAKPLRDPWIIPFRTRSEERRVGQEGTYRFGPNRKHTLTATPM